MDVNKTREEEFINWYNFYKLIKDKDILDENEVALAIVKINFSMERFIENKEQLEEIIFVQGIKDETLSQRRETYTTNGRLYMPRDINLNKGIKTNEEYKAYIYSVVKKIVEQNIDLYLGVAEHLLREDEIEAIDRLTKTYSEHEDLIDRLLKLLYLFKNSETKKSRKDDIKSYLRYSFIRGEVSINLAIDEVLETLVKDEVIYCDWTGSYSVISEEKKIVDNRVAMHLKRVTSAEKNEFIISTVEEIFKELLNDRDFENIPVSIDVEGRKICQSQGSGMIKLDSYIKEDRDIRRGYYVLNTKQYENIIFWYGKRKAELDLKVKYIIAYLNVIEKLKFEWRKDPERLEFLREQEINSEYVIKKLKAEIINGFNKGGYIYRGEDKKIELKGNNKDILNYFINKIYN